MDDFSGLEYDQESVSEEDVISKTNSLLSQFNLPTQITSVTDITASLFVVLYESLFSDRLPGIARQPVTREDEIHNCQMVIDVLSADVIKDNLSHIRGVDIVEGKVQSINNLIDIFTFLYEYVIKQIESDAPTDTEDDVKSLERQEISTEQPELFMPVPLLDAPEMDRGDCGAHKEVTTVEAPDSLRGATAGTKSNTTKAPAAAARSKTKASEMIAPSPIRRNISSSLMGHATLDSTEELIREGERLERQHREMKEQSDRRAAWQDDGNGDKPGQFDFIGVRPLPATVASSKTDAPTVTSTTAKDAYLDSIPVTSTNVAAAHVSYHRPLADFSSEADTNLSATAPLPYRPHRPSSPERLRSTVGALPFHSRQTPEKPYQHKEEPVKGLSSSYTDLHNMVQNTAAMTRAAINSSPLHRRHDRATLLDITDLSRDRQQVAQSEAHELAKELNLGTSPHPFSVGDGQIPRDSRAQRHVNIIHGKPETQDEARIAARENIPPKAYAIPPNTDYQRASHLEEKVSSKLQAEKRPVKQTQKTYHLESEKQGKTQDRLKDRFEDVLMRLDGKRTEDPVVEARKRRAESKDLQAKMSAKLQEMGKASLADAHRHLETEDQMTKRKQDYLRKLYEEEFNDVVEEVKGLVKRDHRLMKDMEEEYKKLMLVAEKAPTRVKPTLPPKPKGFLLPTTIRTKAPQASKSRKKKDSEAEDVKVRERPLNIGEDEELMPILMEEFPHLNISEHTWHELWRKGINQIENLTRAYEENKRRKSQAQVQLEEAAKKHEVLAAIIKKQVDHNSRMREIKEQKRQEVVLKNKIQEKRSQSARARRYYNEYQVRARSKMLKRRTKEELIFKNLFKDGLAIQKERIRDVQKYAKEQRAKQAKKRQDEIDSLENYYRDQFQMLVGKLVTDREEMVAKEKAHQRMLEQMKRDLRRKMEKEIVDIQSEMFRDEDDAYFRQLEADRLRQELQMAKFQTQV